MYSEEDYLQLCAQAMCLEEMLCCSILEGALFYGEPRRRSRILLDEPLRQQVRAITEEMHQFYRRGYTPKVKPTKACNACSLKEFCLPSLFRRGTVARYPLHTLSAILSFSYAGASPALMGACAQRDIDLAFCTPRGRFLARVTGRSSRRYGFGRGFRHFERASSASKFGDLFGQSPRTGRGGGHHLFPGIGSHDPFQ